MKKFLLAFACLLLVTGCKDVKLKDGENAIVTFNEGGISADEFYQELKETYGGEVIANTIDTYLLDKKYETDSETKKYVKQAIKTIKSNAESSGTTFETYISLYYGLSSQDALEKYLTLNYKRNLWVLDYAKETVTDRQVKDYYENYTYGDVEASQILITVDATENATDDEKKVAENKALETAKKVIERLQKGEDFAKLAKEYSKDQTSASNGGSLGKVNTGDIADEALAELRKMKDGSYSTTPVKSSYGYHILYRTSMDAKPELNDEVTDEIKTIVGKEIAEETGFSGKAILALRENNGMKFVDTTLEKLYEKAN